MLGLEAASVYKRLSVMFFRFSVSSEERLKVHQSAVNYLGMACYNKGQNPTNNLSFTSLAGKT